MFKIKLAAFTLALLATCAGPIGRPATITDGSGDPGALKAQAEMWLEDNGMKVATGNMLVVIPITAIQKDDLVMYADESGKISFGFVFAARVGKDAPEGGMVAVDVGDSNTVVLIGVKPDRIKAAFRSEKVNPVI